VVHIILVPLGVSWAFMTLIANYRAVRHGDREAHALAQVHGRDVRVGRGDRHGAELRVRPGVATVQGRWGAAFGVPFVFEGLFFFTEAVFLATYIVGWRRLTAIGTTAHE
jgi:cytochrome d ubiquinol oxidase subunit I